MEPLKLTLGGDTAITAYYIVDDRSYLLRISYPDGTSLLEVSLSEAAALRMIDKLSSAHVYRWAATSRRHL